MWCPRRPLLLPVAGFRPGFVLPARRPRRDHRLGSPRRQELHPLRLQRIRRHHLPALNRRSRRDRPPAPPHWCPGNDVTLPREAGMGRPRWPRLRFPQSPRGIAPWPDMSESLIFSSSRWILACAVLFGAAVLGPNAHAQVNPGAPPPPPQGPAVNPMCPRLEGQLTMIDRGVGGTGDPARDEQIRRYQDAASKQQAELDRVTSQAKR